VIAAVCGVVGGDWDAFFTGCLVIGVVLAGLGAAGQSTGERTLGTGGRFVPGEAGDISVRPGAILILAGVMLLVIGALGHD
jgi:hypothetical protein